MGLRIGWTGVCGVLSVGVLAMGCDQPKAEGGDETGAPDSVDDADGDGVSAEDDCDDDDPAVGGARTWYPDADGDGFGSDDPADLREACDAPERHVDVAGDCDDADATAHPDAEEVAYDGLDQDCDGADLADVDGDGFDAEIAGGEDCDDEDADVHPDAVEVWYDGIDQDCSGDADNDADGDGFIQNADGTGPDCDDFDAGVSPDAAEVLGTGADEDCDDVIDDVLVSDLDTVAFGGSASVSTGATVAIGDLDADGFGDLILGQPGVTTDTASATVAGAVQVFSGRDTGVLAESDALASVHGPAASSFGFAVASADLDGDGVEDLLAGAPHAEAYGDETAGGVYLFLGPVADDQTAEGDGVWIPGMEALDRLGTALDAVDGAFAVGAIGSHDARGAAWVFTSVPPSGDTLSAHRSWAAVGDEPGDEAGRALALLDFDGDGDLELAVGSAGWVRDESVSHRGAAWVVDGHPGDSLSLGDLGGWTGDSAGDSFGLTLAGGCDMDADGYTDLWVGAKNHDATGYGAGAAHLLLGGAAATPSEMVDAGDAGASAVRIDGESGSDRYGVGLTCGDYDDDGVLDVALGGHTAELRGGTTEDSAGAVVVVYGPMSAWGADVALESVLDGSAGVPGGRISAIAVGDRVGHALATGDVDGTRGADLLVGAYGLDTASGINAGAGAVMLGRSR